MLLRVWPDVNPDMQKIGNDPSSAGVIDLGADFSSSRVKDIDSLSPTFGKGVTAIEWSGYVRIEKDDTYVITINKSQVYHKAATLFFFLKGVKVMEFPYGNQDNVVKTATLKLTAGYHPVSFLMVRKSHASFSIKIRPASELDSEPLKVTDFYFRKK